MVFILFKLVFYLFIFAKSLDLTFEIKPDKDDKLIYQNITAINTLSSTNYCGINLNLIKYFDFISLFLEAKT